jgi:probable rRNA maturation factor
VVALPPRAHYLPPWRIDITVRPGVPIVASQASLARLAARALSAAGAKAPASLAVILTNDAEIEPLNVQHMDHEGPTDVLSFPLLPPSAFPGHEGKAAVSQLGPIEPGFQAPPGQRAHLGDIVISVERAIEQAPDSPVDELRQLVVHGVLHICGWDHADSVERDAMRSLERAIMDRT